MKNVSYKKIFLGRRSVGVVICVLLLATSLSAMTATSDVKGVVKQSLNLNKQMTSSDSLSYTFEFSEPSFETTDVDNSEYTLVHMSGCMALGKGAGDPKLPVRFIKLLIPAKKSVKNVEVFGTPVEIELENIDLVETPIVPYQNPVPIGSQPEDFDFVINSELYSSNVVYPSEIYENYNIGYSRGYAILDMPLKPMQYVPSKGEIMYYPEITVTLNLEDTDYVNPFYRNNPEDRVWVENLVWNPEVTEMYTTDIPTFDYPGGLCDPSDHYDYVIVTTEDGGLDYWDTTSSIPYNWESLMDKHADDDGFSCTLVTEQEIDDCDDYENDPPFNDIQAHIREFCKDAYEDWGTQYVLIGGDGEWIPARQMSYDYESNVEADIYWSNLDKNFNADEDYSWGEEGDLGFDLYAELFIGRLTCDTPQDVSNWMTKSFYYADSIEDVYLDNAAFYGGDTTWACQGDDFIDYGAIKGTDDWLGPVPGAHGSYPEWLGVQFGFETWNENNPDNQYDLSVKWTGEPPNPGGWQGGSTSAAIAGLRTAINEDRVTLLSGVAHASSGKSLDVNDYEWESNYHNTKPFFIHDFGCHCGDFYPTDDGVLHSMLFHSDTELAFACIYHTSYGWGSLQDTNSSSALQMKLFWDYFFDMENNSEDFNNWQLGKAMAWSKDAMAPVINWTYYQAPGSWRGTIQACLLFGDPAQQIKTPHPSEPPETPDAPDGPDEWIRDVECTFSAVTTDPEGEQIYYLFDWGDGYNSGWVGPYASGQTAEEEHAWSELGDYEVKVRAKDIWGVVSDWSNISIISIVENQLPSKPEISGSHWVIGGMEYEYTFVATDPDGHDIYYRVDWDDGHGTDWLGLYGSGESISLKHTWTEKGKYWIKAWSKDTLEGKSGQASFLVNVPFCGLPSQNADIQLFVNLLQRIMGRAANS